MENQTLTDLLNQREQILNFLDETNNSFFGWSWAEMTEKHPTETEKLKQLSQEIMKKKLAKT